MTGCGTHKHSKARLLASAQAEAQKQLALELYMCETERKARRIRLENALSRPWSSGFLWAAYIGLMTCSMVDNIYQNPMHHPARRVSRMPPCADPCHHTTIIINASGSLYSRASCAGLATQRCQKSNGHRGRGTSHIARKCKAKWPARHMKIVWSPAADTFASIPVCKVGAT